ncbi:MAG: acyl-CoA dehydrogenase [Cocleimonas sp.]|jgi:acyl-CoA dehydrogenase
MLNLLLLLIAVPGLIALAYRGDKVMFASIFAGALSLISLFSGASIILTIIFLAVTAITLLFSIPSIRSKYVSAPMLSMVRKILPPISETEQEAIDAGTVWWDGEIFSGKPKWNKLLSAAKPEVNAEEQAFLDGPVNELSRMSDSWKINHDWSIIPDHIIKYVLDNGFLGMIIPKKYDGLDFSAVAQAKVLLKLSNTGSGISYLVGVPNSLGPGELLLKYGTENQKDYYLPRLASGQEIPCFALTSPSAGSDATSISDTGVVCMGEYEGKEVLGIKLHFSKRYITLAPIATLIGLAFRLQDPDGLIGDTKDYGITCALIPRSTEGLEIGRRHLPIGDAFLNGPIKGDGIFVPLDSIIGGKEMAGKGWRMLVNCLSVGRAVTLPTTAAVISKRCTLGTSSYANLRSQFGVNIAKFEGVQKPLARMAGLTYIIEAASIQTIQSIVDGNKPSVPSAILKYHCTEMARQCVIDAMDIHGGKAIMKGPGNYIASLYESVPVAITVEGANILTRNLMIFGQGAIRSHPFVLDEMELAHAEDNETTLIAFDKTLSSHIGYSVSNFARSFVHGLGFAGSSINENKNCDSYYADINRLSGVFALAADVSMLSLGAKLKFKENLSARLGDLLSTLYMASMVLKHHKDTGYNEDEWPIVQWSLDHLLHEYQIAFDELTANFPNRALAFAMNTAAFPIGGRFKAPSDNLEEKVVDVISNNNAARDRLTAGLYMELEELNPLAKTNQVFLDSLELKPLQKTIKAAIKSGTLPKSSGQALLDSALEKGVIDKDQAKKLNQHHLDVMEIVNVDDFDESELIRVAYKKTRAKKSTLNSVS